MGDFLSQVASGAGLEDHETHHGVGAMLAFLKGRLNPEAYAHLKNAIPNSEQMLSAFHPAASWHKRRPMTLVDSFSPRLIRVNIE